MNGPSSSLFSRQPWPSPTRTAAAPLCVAPKTRASALLTSPLHSTFVG
jgi:hypothetical protein